MTHSWCVALLAVWSLALTGCGEHAKVTDELNQLRGNNASADQVRAAIFSHSAGDGKQKQGREAEDLIRQFCGEQDRINGLRFLKTYGKVSFFSTPDMTIFAFFDADDRLKEFLVGTQ